MDEEEIEESEVTEEAYDLERSNRDSGMGDDCGDGLFVNVEQFGPEEDILMGDELRLPVGVDHPVRREDLGGVPPPPNLESVVDLLGLDAAAAAAWLLSFIVRTRR
mgnify:CR=1 FL=1